MLIVYKKKGVLLLTRGDTNDYVDQIKPHTKALIENQLNEMQSTNVIMTLRVELELNNRLILTVTLKTHVENPGMP